MWVEKHSARRLLIVKEAEYITRLLLAFIDIAVVGSLCKWISSVIAWMLAYNYIIWFEADLFVSVYKRVESLFRLLTYSLFLSSEVSQTLTSHHLSVYIAFTTRFQRIYIYILLPICCLLSRKYVFGRQWRRRSEERNLRTRSTLRFVVCESP